MFPVKCTHQWWHCTDKVLFEIGRFTFPLVTGVAHPGSTGYCGKAEHFYLQWDWPWMRCLLWWHPPENGSHVWTRPSCFSARPGMPWTKKKNYSNKDLELLNSHIIIQINPLRLRRKETEAHCICPQWGQGIKVIQRGLGSLDSLHTGVDGSSQGLLCWSLWTQKLLSLIWSTLLWYITYSTAHDKVSNI